MPFSDPSRGDDESSVVVVVAAGGEDKDLLVELRFNACLVEGIVPEPECELAIGEFRNIADRVIVFKALVRSVKDLGLIRRKDLVCPDLIGGGESELRVFFPEKSQ